MRIAINALAATRGGAVTMLTPFLSALRQLEPEWQFALYVSDPSLNVSVDGVTSVVLRTDSWRRAWHDLVALDRRARRDGAVLMLNLLNSGSVLPRLPSITWQRNALYFDRGWLDDQPLRMRLEAAVRRSVALLTCRASVVTVAPSQTMANYVRNWALGRDLRIEVIFHGVDPERFTVAHRTADGKFMIGVMGHAAAHRGLATAVRVLAEVRDGGVDAGLVLTVARYGNPAFQSTIDDVAGIADLLGLSEEVAFAGDTKDPAAWYRNLDLLLIPSECESFCFPLVEGLASGLPVVTTGLPVLREIGGDLAMHGDTVVDMAAHALKIHGETERQRLRRQELARTRAEGFSWDEAALKVRALVTNVLDRAGP